MSYDVFISYAHIDKSMADAVCATLEQQGIRCWIAPRDIQPGADWGLSIIDAIKSCRAIALVFSAGANSSPQVLREVERAIHQGIPVIPFRIENVLPQGALEYHLGTVHWLDAMTPPLEAHLRRLADALLLLLGRPIKSATPTPSAAIADKSTASAGAETAPAEQTRPPADAREFSVGSANSAPTSRINSNRLVLSILLTGLAVATVVLLSYREWFRPINPVLVRTLTGHSDAVDSVAYSPDGRQLASGGRDNAVKLWDVTTGEELHTFGGHDINVCCVAISSDGQLLASADISGNIKLWDMSTKREATKLIDVNPELHKGVDAIAFSPDSRRLAAGYDDQNVRVWDVVTGERKQTIATGQMGFISALSYSPDGRLLASGSGSGTVKLWDVMSGQELRVIAADDDIHSVSFSPDGRELAVAGYDQTVTLWSVPSGEKLRTLNGNASYVHSVAFSPDGHWLISGTADNAVQVWDASSGHLLKSLSGHDGIVFSVAFSPDGRHFASAGDDHTIKLWASTGGK